VPVASAGIITVSPDDGTLSSDGGGFADSAIWRVVAVHDSGIGADGAREDIDSRCLNQGAS